MDGVRIDGQVDDLPELDVALVGDFRVVGARRARREVGPHAAREDVCGHRLAGPLRVVDKDLERAAGPITSLSVSWRVTAGVTPVAGAPVALLTRRMIGGNGSAERSGAAGAAGL